MKKFLLGVVALLSLVLPLAAQVVVPSSSLLSGQGAAPQDVLAVFATLSATGNTASISLVGDPGVPSLAGTGTTRLASVYTPRFSSVQAFVTGSPTTCTYRVYGTLKLPQESPAFPADYQDLSGALDCTTAAGQFASIYYKPATAIVVSLTALAGGTSPTVQFRYLGVH